MEDLFDVQTKHMDVVFKAAGGVQADDLVSRACYEVSTATHLVISSFQANRFNDVQIDEAKLRAHIFASVEWVTALFYVFELDPPEVAEICQLAEQMDSEVAADAVLAALYAQRSLADVTLDHFCQDGHRPSLEDIDLSLGEILACLELIARRLGSTLTGLIMNG